MRFDRGPQTMFRSASLAGRLRLSGPLACFWHRSSAAAPPIEWCVPQPDTTNVVQRPTYEVEGEKTLYLGGYAGANYQRPGR